MTKRVKYNAELIKNNNSGRKRMNYSKKMIKLKKKRYG